jgi:hypothetical protein
MLNVYFWRCGPTRAMASSFLRFLDHTRHITVGRTPLDEWSARRRDLYLTTLNTDKYPCSGGIRTHNPSKRAAVDPRFRPRGHWDRLQCLNVTAKNHQHICVFMMAYFTARKYGGGSLKWPSTIIQKGTIHSESFFFTTTDLGTANLACNLPCCVSVCYPNNKTLLLTLSYRHLIQYTKKIPNFSFSVSFLI